MQEVETQGVHFTNILGDNLSIKRAGKLIHLVSNKNYSFSDNKSRLIFNEDNIIIGAKTFAMIGDSTKYPDPYTIMTILPNSEFRLNIEPWEFIDKAKDKYESGFKITNIELIKGIFKIETGSDIKAKNIKFVFSNKEKKGNIKIELTSNAVYVGGNNFKISGPFSNIPLNVTQFSEYIIRENKFYKKSMLAMNEDNRADERFMMLDNIFLKVISSAMNIGQYKDSDKMYEQMDKNANEFNSNDIIKNFETAMNMTPEMLKNSGLSVEQIKQATEGMAKLKKEMTPDKMSEFKNAISKVKKEDLIKVNKGMKEMGKKIPKSEDIIKEYESLVPYGKLPNKQGECEEMEEL
jgi:hypothetical protein